MQEELVKLITWGIFRLVLISIFLSIIIRVKKDLEVVLKLLELLLDSLEVIHLRKLKLRNNSQIELSIILSLLQRSSFQNSQIILLL